MKASHLPPERSADPAFPEPSPHPARAEALWEVFLSRDNLARALRRLERNGGAPGPDGMTVEALPPHLKIAWPEIRQSLDAGTYRPAPVRRVTIPKPGGGERELGVPTVLDRFLPGSAPLHRAMPNRYWADLGLVPIGDRVQRLWDRWRTAGCGPARPVVWEGPG